PGPFARVDLAHFSDRTVAVRKRWVEEITPVNAETVQGRNDSHTLNLQGNPAPDQPRAVRRDRRPPPDPGAGLRLSARGVVARREPSRDAPAQQRARQ